VKIHENIDSLPRIKKPIVTVGTFDGVHVGHQKIIARINELAKQEGGESVLLTFNPHPRLVLFPEDENIKLITTTDEKNAILESLGLNHVIYLPFEKSFSLLSAQEYVRDFLVNKIGVHTMVIGYDHHFGRNRLGNLALLKELSLVYNFKVEEISAHAIDAINVSSTKVRSALLEGNIVQANEYLGHPFTLSGTVEKGSQIGRTIGYPTANLHIKDTYKILPKLGVYSVEVIFNNERLKGMMNIGSKPTINNDEVSKMTIEVHIFDFSQNIYDNPITIIPSHYIREEQKFSNVEELKIQLAVDKLKSLELLK
jgi:riboflavin kinase/FMN adenylyltransferase